MRRAHGQQTVTNRAKCGRDAGRKNMTNAP
jgi:hypothetical protein